MDKVLRVTVPVHLTGEAKGVKAEGGIVDFVHRDLDIECLPADIPEHITVDITELMLHDGMRVRDLPAGGKWKAVSDADMLIVHVVPPKVEAEPAPADARRRRGGAGGAGRARGHQEGQDREAGRGEGRRRGAGCDRWIGRRGREAGRGSRQSGPRVRRDAAQRRLRGDRSAWRGGTV